LCQLPSLLFLLIIPVKDHRKLLPSDQKQIFRKISVIAHEGWIGVLRMLQNFRTSHEFHTQSYQY